MYQHVPPMHALRDIGRAKPGGNCSENNVCQLVVVGCPLHFSFALHAHPILPHPPPPSDCRPPLPHASVSAAPDQQPLQRQATQCNREQRKPGEGGVVRPSSTRQDLWVHVLLHIAPATRSGCKRRHLAAIGSCMALTACIHGPGNAKAARSTSHA